MTEIKVNPPFIKLEQFLKFAGAAETGGHAKILIQDGQIEVNDEICTMRGKKLHNGDKVKITGEDEVFLCVIEE